MNRSRRTFHPFVSLLLRWAWVCGAVGTAAFAGQDNLRGELEALAAQSGFVIEGLDWVGSEPARNVAGPPAERLRVLLREYNYLVVHGPSGALQKVRISSRRTEAARGAADGAYVGTVRVGSHHQVEALLVGPNGSGETVPLIVDTGASTLVLPESMIPELGFTPADLREAESQAAGGKVPVKLGVLRSVRVGTVSAADVPVSFIADRRLGGTKLLGMSFLQRFRITIDDERNELILLAR